MDLQKKKKKKGKEKEKNIDHNSACIQSPASNCFYAHMFCYLRVQLSVLYAIAESKAIIWPFWVYCLNVFRFTRTILVRNFKGMSFVFWYANYTCNVWPSLQFITS